MALGSQLPIRLDAAVDARLQSAADLAGTSKSALIRMLAKTFVDQCISPTGKVTLPPDWHELLPRRDGRSNQPSVGHQIKQVGDKNFAIGHIENLPSASDAHARKPVKGRKGKRGKTKGEE